MPFTPKDWRDATGHDGGGDTSTPLTAAALEDMETRLSNYSDSLLTNIFSNTYTPTITNGGNVAASTPHVVTYVRLSSAVFLFGYTTIDPTATGATSWAMSLPIASNFANFEDAAGIMGIGNLVNQAGIMFADTVNDRFSCEMNSAQTASASVQFVAGYRII
jgi:hypothetical protein